MNNINTNLSVAIGISSILKKPSAGGPDGIGGYTNFLTNALTKCAGISLSQYAFGGESDANSICAGNYEWPLAKSILFGSSFTKLASRLPLDISVIHAPDHRIPKIAHKPVVATIHDAIALSDVQSLRSQWRSVQSLAFQKSAHWASSIITVSSHSKNEIVKWFQIPEDKVSVTPLGVDDGWYRDVSTNEIERVQALYSLPDRFFFFVGTFQPRKNIRRVIDAHKSLPPRFRRDVPLVLAGRHGWSCDAEVAELQNCDDGTMRWIQYVPSQDLLPIYKKATALVWPSLNEGFGLPVLEAFAARLPVITSDTTSLPEVAGDAALLVNPESVGEIAEAMQTIVCNESLQTDLRHRGHTRAKLFTWDQTARQTIDVYREAIESFRKV